MKLKGKSKENHQLNKLFLTVRWKLYLPTHFTLGNVQLSFNQKLQELPPDLFHSFLHLDFKWGFWNSKISPSLLTGNWRQKLASSSPISDCHASKAMEVGTLINRNGSSTMFSIFHTKLETLFNTDLTLKIWKLTKVNGFSANTPLQNFLKSLNMDNFQSNEDFKIAVSKLPEGWGNWEGYHTSGGSHRLYLGSVPFLHIHRGLISSW